MQCLALSSSECQKNFSNQKKRREKALLGVISDLFLFDCTIAGSQMSVKTIALIVELSID